MAQVPPINDAQLQLLRKANAMMKTLGIEQERQLDIQDEIVQGRIQSIQQLRNEVTIVRQHAVEERRVTKQLKDQQKVLKEQEKLVNDLTKLQSDLVKGPLAKAANLTDDQLAKDREILQNAKNAGKITQAEFDKSNAQLDLYERMYGTVENMTEKQKEARKFANEQYKALDGFQKGLTDVFDKIPGGKALAKLFDFDLISQELQKAVITRGLNVKMLAGMTAAFTALFAIAKSLSDEADKFAANTGITFGQARKLADESRNIANNLDVQLARNEDIMKVQEKTISNFGTVLMITTKQAAQVAELGKAYSYGAETAAGFNNVMMTMGATVSEAYDIQNETAALALKSGVAVGTVTKDIAQNGKAAMKYFTGNSKALATSAVEAAKMGTSLAGLVKTADALLNIQDSLTKQFEFQALTGRQIDLDKARQLAYDGKIAEATKETLDALEQSGDLSELRPNALRKAAELAGVETEQLMKSVEIRKKLKNATVDELAAANGLNISAEKLASMDKDQILSEAKKQQAISQSTAELDDFKNTLTVAIAPAAEAIGKLFQGLAPILKIAAAILTPIAWIISGITKPLEWIGMLFTWINEQLAEWFGGSEKVAQVMEVIENIFTGIGLGLSVVIIPNMLKQLKLTIQTMMANKEGLKAQIKNAVAGIFGGASKAGLIGLAAAGAGVGLLFSMLSNAESVGDAAFGAGGNTAILSPTEGAIFPSQNDEIAVGPGVIGMAKAGGSTQPVVAGGSSTDMTETNNLLRQLLNKQSVAVVNWGDRDTRNVSDKLTSDRSLRQSNLGGTA